MIREKIGESAGQIMGAEVPPAIRLLGPWLCEGNLVMLYATRGVGKTYVALSVAFSAASGQKFLKWEEGVERSVVYFDGEMGREQIHRRCWQIDNSQEESVNPARLKFITLDHCNNAMPNLADEDQHDWYRDQVQGHKLIVIDNLLTCSGPVDSRDDEVSQWKRIQKLLLEWRAQGKCVLLIHHAGKSGTQLGTSQRENIMDTIIGLHPASCPAQRYGTAFEWRFEKHRNFWGDDAKPLHVELVTEGTGIDSKVSWHHTDLYDLQNKEIAKAHKTVKSKEALAQMFGVALHRVYQAIDAARGDNFEQLYNKRTQEDLSSVDYFNVPNPDDSQEDLF